MNILNKIENLIKYQVREKGYKNTIKKQEEEIIKINDEKEKEIRLLENDNTRLNNTIKKLKDEKVTIVRDSTFLIDFKKLNAFSIERSIKDEKQETVIGYKDKDGDVKEWFLLCSLDTHEKLCNLFKKQILLKEIEIPEIPYK